MNLSQLSARQLHQAASIKEKIDELEAELTQILGNNDDVADAGGPRKRTMSPSAIAKIRAAAKARWAREKSATGTGGRRTRRKMSPAAKARLAAIARARWKKAKAEGRTAL
jgi:hypothetical protein